MKTIFTLLAIIVLVAGCRKDKEFIVNEAAKALPKGILVEKQTITTDINGSDTIFEVFEYSGDKILRCSTFYSSPWGNIPFITEYTISKDSINYIIFNFSNIIKGTGVYHLQNSQVATHKGWSSLYNISGNPDYKTSLSSFYTYDNNGYLIKTENFNYENDSLISQNIVLYDIENGNTVAKKFVTNDTCFIGEKYEFDLSKNNTNLEDKINFWMGKSNTNMLTQTKWFTQCSVGTVPDRIIDFTNIADEYGNIKKIEIKETSGNGCALPYNKFIQYKIIYQ